MPAPTFTAGLHSIGPGYLYWAPLGTAEPTHAASGSAFSDSWPAGWVALGYTDDGHVFEFGSTTSAAEAAESPDPLAYTTDARAGAVSVGLLGLTASNFKKVFNGSAVVTSGSGATSVNTWEPPNMGSEVRCMLGWEATDLNERYVWRQCFQGGTSAIARRKGAANRAIIPATFNLELPATGSKLFAYVTAGTARA